MKLRIFLSSLVITWIALGAVAQAAVQQTSAAELVRELGERAVATPHANGAVVEPRSVRFRNMMNETFDLPFISQFALGEYWDKATPKQRADYMALFGDYMFHKYWGSLSGYIGKRMVIVSERPAGPRDVLVNTRIEHRSRPPVEAGWIVRSTDDGGRIIDVRVNGTSMLYSQRSEFASVIEQQGLQGLIEVMRARTTKD